MHLAICVEMYTEQHVQTEMRAPSNLCGDVHVAACADVQTEMCAPSNLCGDVHVAACADKVACT